MVAALGDPDGVLIGDDTGFEKKGACSAGVQRQYTGTAGKITNCQLGVFLAYASPKGRALVDRELYLPRSWTGDEARLAAAEVPEDTAFRTKPQLLQADDRAGGRRRDPVRLGHRRRGLRGQRAAARLPRGTSRSPTCWRSPATTWSPRPRAAAARTSWPRAAEGAWQRLSCGNGAKGRRWYDWALFATNRPEISLLVRRSASPRPSELAFYLCHTPQPAPLGRPGQGRGHPLGVEECFQAAKNEAGLDHYQVRLYKAWYRYVTLAMLALAWLAVTRAALADGSDRPA